MIEAYIAAFARCYPQKSIAVDVVWPKKRGEPPKYAIIIDADRGNFLLSESDMLEATRMFNRGKVH